VNTLWDIPAYRPGNETQEAAAKAIAPNASGLREQIYHLILASDGLTNEEIANGLGIKLQTVCGRVNELQGSRGLPARIEWSGEYRNTSSGCRAKVWRARA